MYIKIKHIKQFLLLSACAFFALFNYFSYVKADNTRTDNRTVCDKALDADCDGLTDAEEKLYGTDSRNTDTDGDSYSDGVEVKSGYDPTKPAPGDKIANFVNESMTPNASASTVTDTLSMTTQFVQELQGYADSQSGQAISSADLQSLMGTSIEEKIGEAITWDSLAGSVDQTKIKTFSQAYPTLNAAEKKARIQQDSYVYITKIGYLLDSSLPVMALNSSDLEKFGTDFKDHLLSLTTDNPDVEYFSDLGDRLELFSNQTANIEVPETMLDIHVKALSFVNALLALRDLQSPVQDPLASLILFSKIQNLIDLGTDFLENDVQNYFNQIQ